MISRINRCFQLVLLISLSAILLTACAPKGRVYSAVPTERYVGWGVAIDLPVGTEVVKKTPVHDFDNYTFSIPNSVNGECLYAYVGNHPDMEAFSKDGVGDEINQRSGLHTKRVCWLDDSRLHNADVLVKLQIDFPAYIHFWYRGISEEGKGVLDRIIGSAG